GQLQYIQLARANLPFKEKRWKDCVFYELEHAYLAIQGSGFSKDYKFDDLPRQTSLMFSTKDWDERCEIEFSMLGNFGRAILNANLKEKDLINMFQNSRYKGLPYIIPRQKCIKYIHKNYMELVKETNHK
ncbi:MAG: hypothetical protein IKD78_12745, partial [Bacteroidales bacterium]|nr:hypothetical protein [Bacteroidales bacterium]